MSGEIPAPDEAPPVLSILVVNFNSTRLLGDCLEAIFLSSIADLVGDRSRRNGSAYSRWAPLAAPFH